MVDKVKQVVERMGIWTARMAFKRLVESHFQDCLALEHIEKYEAISFVSRRCLRTGCPLLGMSTIMFNISLVPSVYFKVRRPSLLVWWTGSRSGFLGVATFCLVGLLIACRLCGCTAL